VSWARQLSELSVNNSRNLEITIFAVDVLRFDHASSDHVCCSAFRSC